MRLENNPNDDDEGQKENVEEGAEAPTEPTGPFHPRVSSNDRIAYDYWIGEGGTERGIHVSTREERVRVVRIYRFFDNISIGVTTATTMASLLE
ncbi:hypothetical protein DM860_005663 [Cuscuta australis]|uniref:Uncharacterized protein n=1 Tax=Cuscuta australis TaxID=267555 RepID=A0A328DUZ8_9ASTE|nr:hypothetical protein DM860_005663 [Cuscuta australis]